MRDRSQAGTIDGSMSPEHDKAASVQFPEESSASARSARYLLDTLVRGREFETPLYGLDPDEPEAPPREELEQLAQVYRCRPDQLIEAAGRQLRRLDGDVEPSHQHLDVLALEVIARVSFLSGIEVGGLPHIEDSTIALTAHISHVQHCDHCMAATRTFSDLFPHPVDFQHAQPLVVNDSQK